MGKLITLPRVDASMETGFISQIYVSEQDSVKEGDRLFELESNKATDEITSTTHGIVLKIFCNEGDELPIGAPILYIGEAGETVPPVSQTVP